MANITRAALVAAAADLNKVLNLDPAIDVKLGVAQLRDQVVEAAMVMSADKDDLQKLAASTREAIIALRDDVIAAVPRIRDALIEAMQKEGEDEEAIAREAGGSEEEKVAAVTFVLDELAELHADDPASAVKAAKPEKAAKESGLRRVGKAARETNATASKPATQLAKSASKSSNGARASRAQLGKFKQVNDGTSLAKIVRSIFAGNDTIDKIAQSAGIRPDQVVHRIRYRLRVDHGIDSVIGADNIVSFVSLGDKTEVDIIRQRD